jgi:hypothetical protein
MDKQFDDLEQALRCLPVEMQRQLFKPLLPNFLVHPLEGLWNVPADFILEAISRSQDITKRGVRGIVAELCFSHFILDPMVKRGWQAHELSGDLPYDALLSKATCQVKIQVKNQRLKLGQPLKAHEHSVRKFSAFTNWWIAECQKTRSGIGADGLATRPYRFGEFDVLAVCLHPSTNDWSKFMFTPSKCLFPRPVNSSLIEIMQPVPPTKQMNWTDDLDECISWL